MNKKLLSVVVCIGLTTLLSACNEQSKAKENAIKLDTDMNKASYSIGLQMGSQISKIKDMINEDAIVMGFKDSLSGKEPQLTAEVMQSTMQTFQKSMMEKQMAEQKAKVADNKAEGDKFLAENKTKEGVKTTESGLQYKVITAGTGATPGASDTVVTHYKGTLINGKVFDSSYKRNTPATFPVNGVIKGWTEALQLMKVGSKWQLYIPAELAYGERGAGKDIGPGQTLLFEIELLEIKTPKAEGNAAKPETPKAKGNAAK
ncbi:FKBP-type peptidyl-prolyl cis-trans isomerase FklB [hydrothermal vent metagenome]|uniref:peptidylprolyl isomerase n=1 Tax=hydrothermal vent metagenome TaxID=652676 RepID=A0A3B0X8C1_9ZZZZ